MVPENYLSFFTTMAAAGATLFGLIFVAISIAPENITHPSVHSDRQFKATAAYVALLNPLLISLFALVPNQWIGIAAMVLSWVGILNTIALAVTLVQSSALQTGRVRNIGLLLISLILYSFEAFVSSKLYGQVIDTVWLSILADLLIFITLFGIVRAWELIGIRHFRIRDWIIDLVSKRKRQGKDQEADASLDAGQKK